ncbi:hypothetical protein BK731_00600 [Bacillus thuringiensis serovar muju]|uniref:Uncharacterized protein n=2 Tax=Bacillus fungorum TaxID=2039284 RepID=A0A2G6Q5R8_9BACI|nr:hypothetical protein [Bacillus thuringiensis]OTY11311.1 hypothetical protein BK731_00600 [Bacillus thuringiensis serovar muju]PIE92167.1 hypothetical protein CO726_28125 [Bacillus fungorum]
MATSIVTLGLFLLLHYVIEPRKEKKRKKSEQFKELYAPLYMIINARLGSLVMYGRKYGAEQLYFNNAGAPGIINDNYMIEFVLKNSSYASNELLSVLDIHIRNVSEERYKYIELENLVKVIVKEYQQLRKELKLKYDEKELETGLPTKVREIREERKN